MSRLTAESYKTAAMLFSISGAVFAIVIVVSGKIGVFLPIGIALVIAGIGFWQRSKELSYSGARKPDL